MARWSAGWCASRGALVLIFAVALVLAPALLAPIALAIGPDRLVVAAVALIGYGSTGFLEPIRLRRTLAGAS
jgi:hypothetical protein